jgi:hypothetical protein
MYTRFRTKLLVDDRNYVRCDDHTSQTIPRAQKARNIADGLIAPYLTVL